MELGMNIGKWIKDNTTDLTGKTVAITGSSGNLGKQLCKTLVKLNANLIFLNRNVEKSLILKEELLKINGDISIDIIKVDFEFFKTVKEAVNELRKYRVDILVINAGAYKIERRKSDLNFDNVYQINFVSPYYLIRKMIENKMCKKVVVVSSIAHNYSKLNENDIDFSHEKRASKVYGNSKRFLMFSLYELFKDKKDINFSVVHPGITLTNITSHFNRFIFMCIKYPMKIIFMSNKKAVLSIVKGIFDKCDYKEWIGPRVFDVWGKPKKKSLKTCNSVESGEIFKISEKIYSNICFDD